MPSSLAHLRHSPSFLEEPPSNFVMKITAKRWGGGAVGLVKGSLVVFIAVWLLRGSYIPPEAVEGSRLLKFFASANPLSFFL